MCRRNVWDESYDRPDLPNTNSKLCLMLIGNGAHINNNMSVTHYYIIILQAYQQRQEMVAMVQGG